MTSFDSCIWSEFKDLISLFSSLSDTNLSSLLLTQPNETPPPTIYYLKLTHFELSYMDFNKKRLEKTLKFLIRLPLLKSLNLSFFLHKLKPDQLTEILLKYIPKIQNLENFEVNFCHNEEEPFSEINYEQIGQMFGSIKKLNSLTLFFDGDGFHFSADRIRRMLGQIKILEHLKIDFLTEEIDFESCTSLLSLVKKMGVQKLIINVDEGIFSLLKAFSFENKDRPSLETFDLKTIKLSSLDPETSESVIDISDKKNLKILRSSFKYFERLEEINLNLNFPLYPLSFDSYAYIANSLIFPNATKICLKTSSRTLIIRFLSTMIGNDKCLTLVIKESPCEFTNPLHLEGWNLNNLGSILGNQLIVLRLYGMNFGNLELKNILSFKYLTEIEVGLNGFGKLFQNRRKRMMIMGWALKKYTKQTFKRIQILGEILSFLEY